MRYDAVIFDLFGTLIELMRLSEYEVLMTDMAAALGVPREAFRREWFDAYPKRVNGKFPSVEASLEHICRLLDAPTVGVPKAAALRCDYSRLAFRLQPEAVETLTALRKSRVKTGLISDCTPEIPEIWRKTPLAELINAPIFSCSVGLKKPDPRIYHLACERLGVAPERCLYIGDGSSDELSGASAVGMHAVLIRGEEGDDIYSDLHPEADTWQGDAITSLKEVLSFVD